MVKAILEGRKTQTRRVVKPQPKLINGHDFEWKDLCYSGSSETGGGTFVLNCLFGQPGDRLWVRETFIEFPAGSFNFKTEPDPVFEQTKTPWKPSIHMPKTAARIWLEVEEVKVERLQDISEEDSYREGIKSDGLMVHCAVCNHGYHNGTDLICEDGFFYTARSSFQSLWHSINGVGSWEANPWVWVVKFKVLSTTGMK